MGGAYPQHYGNDNITSGHEPLVNVRMVDTEGWTAPETDYVAVFHLVVAELKKFRIAKRDVYVSIDDYDGVYVGTTSLPLARKIALRLAKTLPLRLPDTEGEARRSILLLEQIDAEGTEIT
jgi:hypothetical protein